MKNKKRVGFLSLFLSLLTVFSLLSVYPPISAQEIVTSQTFSSDGSSQEPFFQTAPNPDFQGDAVEILCELEDRREANVKHFLLSDGTIRAVVYSENVHCKDADGNWQEIDNTLTPAKDSAALYQTGDLRLSFAKSAVPNEKLFTLKENGYSVSMSYLSGSKTPGGTAVASVGTVENSPAKKQPLRLNSIETLPKSASGKIRYAGFPEGVELVYELRGSEIKESIVLSAPGRSEYVYAFQMETEGLTVVLNKNGTVSLNDSESGAEKYRIPLPYMLDAAGERSNDVYYSLIPAGENRCLLTVTAESQWINSSARVFPVTIDPTLTATPLCDTYIDSAAPDTNCSTSLDLWIAQSRIPFIKATLPALPSNAKITSADLWGYFFYYDKVTDGTLTAGAYQVLEDWNASTLTWNIANRHANLGISTELLSSAEMSGAIGAYRNTPKSVRFDVTAAASAWYAGSPNYGIAIKYLSGTNGSVILHSLESNAAYHAYFSITYNEPHIENGVYRIKNAANNMYLDTRGGGRTAGTAIQQWAAADSSSEYNQLYKITYLGTRGEGLNYYSIRPMTNNELGLSAPDNSSGNVTLAEMSTTENINYLDHAQRWVISQVGDYYTFRNGYSSNTNYMVAPDTSTSGAQIVTSASSTRNKWILEKYDKPINYAIFIKFTPEMFAGTTFDFDGCMASSVAGQNGPVTWEIKGEDGVAFTAKGKINETTGVFDAYVAGRIQVRMKNPGLNSVFFGLVTIKSYDGRFFIENPNHEQYVQVDDDDAPEYKNNGGIAEVQPFDGTECQQWVFTRMENEYYKICSKVSGYAITVPEGKESKEEVDLVLKPYTGSDNQKWKITKTRNGSYKIKAKSSESITDRDLVMVIETHAFYDKGWNIQQRKYIDNDSYKDEWDLYNISTSLKINVDVVYDQAYSKRYSDPVSRIIKQMRTLQELYLSKFGLWIEYATPASFISFTDEYCTTSPDQACTHANNSACQNSVLYTDGSMELYNYHHNNLFNLMLRIPLPDTSKAVKLAFTGHVTCIVDENFGHISQPYYGLTFPDFGLMMVMNFDSAVAETKTTVHEFGHLFDAPDHYDDTGEHSIAHLKNVYPDRTFNDSCIYGKDKDSDNVMNNLIICDGCKKTILENIEATLNSWK